MTGKEDRASAAAEAAPASRGLLDRVGADFRFQAAIDQAVRRGLPLPPFVRAQVLADVAGGRGLTTYKTFREFVQARNPSLLAFEHVERAIPAVERICAGQMTRAMVLWPTQYFKSEIFSRLLPAYYLLKHPSRTVALASYSSDLAWELSGEARDYYAESGGKFKDGSAKGSTRNWRTMRTRGTPGGMWATGIGGIALGKGFNLGIVDDPIDPLQVRSRAYQRRFALWWPNKWLRGERPVANALVFVMQRLAVDDPASWLLEREAEGGEAAHGWHVLAFDEVKSNEPFGRWNGPRGFPETCTVEPDPRQVGEVLSPSWRSVENVRRAQAQAGPLTTASQRQQRPMLPTGDFWPLKAFQDRVVDALPAGAFNRGWDWDLAYTKEEANSASAGVESARGPGKPDERIVYVVDVDFDWLEFPELIDFMKEKNGPHHVEKKASGKSAVQTLKTYGIAAEEVPVIGDKLARAAAVQHAVLNGRVIVLRHVFQKLLYAESQGLLRVTAESLQAGSEGLDVNDAFVQALWRHLEINSVAKRAARFG